MHCARQMSPATVVMQDAPLAATGRINGAAQRARSNGPAVSTSRRARISPPSKRGREALVVSSSINGAEPPGGSFPLVLQETGTIALNTRLPFWKMLIVAFGPNVGVIESGQRPFPQVLVLVWPARSGDHRM